MKPTLLALLALLALAISAVAAEPVQHRDLEWEEACGGSNIAVTAVGGKLVTIDAVVEHSAEGRQWQCHFADGQIVSAVYRHFKVVRKAASDGGEFTTETIEDRVEVFHLPGHDLTKLEAELRDDLANVIAIAMGRGKAR